MQSLIKFTSLTLFSILLFSASVWAAPVFDNTLRISQPDGSFMDADILPPAISRDQTGTAVFSCAPTHWQNSAGEPGIPWQTVTVLLPPHTDTSTVSCSVVSAEYETIEETWNVAPIPPITTRDNNGNELTIWPKDKTIVDGYDVDIYSGDAFWPSEDTRLIGTGKLRGWNLAEIAVPLVIYNPIRGQLRRLVRAEVMIDYDSKDQSKSNSVKTQRLKQNRGLDRIKKLAINFEQAVADYEPASMTETQNAPQVMTEDEPEDAQGDILPLSPGGASGYVIIVPNSIRTSLGSTLDDFVAHKQSKGYTVHVITETDTGATQVGDPAATKLREWLQANYQTLDLKYALIIGDPRPAEGYVPMKLYPCDARDIPTDYFYAELTCDWDKDNDGIIGERGDNATSGDEIERYFEVYVGRIPYYDNINDTKAILQKTMNYENATNTYWRRHVILPMVPLDTNMQSYDLGERIKADLLEPRAISSDRVYREGYDHHPDDYAIIPPAEYPPSAYPATVWSQGQYGLNVWSTHGWSGGASDIISSGDTPDLNDNYPTTTFQGSCETAYPYSSSNLTYSILKNGGIVANGATRNAYYSASRSYPDSPTTMGMGYRYAKGIVEGKSCGEALWDLKEETSSWWTHNWTLFNPYGDPSVTVILEAPPFTVSPTDAFCVFRVKSNSSGTSYRSYTLTNNSDAATNWTAAKTAAWLDVPVGGTIPAGNSTVIDISINSTADSLPYGVYTDTIIFTDTTNSIVEQRDVDLNLIPPMMVGHWKLDETSGTTAGDSSGDGNDGILMNMDDAGWVGGKFGNALDFDDVNDYLYMEDFSLPRESFTVVLWFKPVKDLSSSNSRRDLMYWHNGGEPHLSFNRAGDGKIGLYVDVDDVEYDDVTTATTSWSAAVWYHIVVTFDGSDFNVYLNGALENIVNHPGIHVAATGLSVGSDEGSKAFGCTIDDIRFYNYALSSAAVQALLQGGRAENPIPQDLAANVRPYTGLQWLSGCSASAHDVYIGEDSDSVLNATTSSVEYKGRRVEEFLTGVTLKENTEYFWRVDEAIGAGRVIRGAVWRFVTGVAGMYEQILEAEDAVLSGPEVASSHPGYTGTGFADYMNMSDDYIEWSVFAHYTGSHDIMFRYALGAGDRPLEIRVNGEVVDASLAFPATGSYDVWDYSETLGVTLNAGFNTIRATAIGDKGANIDHLKVVDDYAYAPPVSGLQVYLKLDESSGSIAADASHGRRDGVLRGDPGWLPAGGKFAGALQLDGLDDYVEITSYKGVVGCGPRTVAAWIKTSGVGEIVSWGEDSPGKRWSLGIGGRAGTFGINVGEGYVFGVTRVMDGQWHHIAGVLEDDGSADANEIRLYLDGRAETLSAIGSHPVETSGGVNVKVGTFDDGWDRYFAGLVDEVVIFDQALTSRQVARLFRLGGESFTVPCGRVVLDRDYDLVGDIDKNCKVDAFDFLLLAEGWLGSGSGLLGDLDDSKTIDWIDFSDMSDNWHEEVTWLGPPEVASGPNPSDGSVGVFLNASLSFEPGAGAVSHDVYFGTENPPPFQGNQTETSFSPGMMSLGTTYYWRIDEVNAYGKAAGAVWNFTTSTGGGR
ncbi:MAG: hypothetical protein JW720_10875 [Sedimentisphaerales bacterium]|nr:hypothetical protein [Sedimentisphaerales bacterium]